MTSNTFKTLQTINKQNKRKTNNIKLLENVKTLTLADPPAELMTIINFIEQQARVKVRVISVGPDREQTIFWD